MNATQLQFIGREIFGHFWRKPFAEKINVNPLTLRGWIARDNVPAEYERWLWRIAADYGILFSHVPKTRTKRRVHNNGHLLGEEAAT